MNQVPARALKPVNFSQRNVIRFNGSVLCLVPDGNETGTMRHILGHWRNDHQRAISIAIFTVFGTVNVFMMIPVIISEYTYISWINLVIPFSLPSLSLRMTFVHPVQLQRCCKRKERTLSVARHVLMYVFKNRIDSKIFWQIYIII